MLLFLGYGMTSAQFKKRWMTLGYNRERHQGLNVEFPPGRIARLRRAYGRNGVGRHANASTDSLLDRVFSKQEQMGFAFQRNATDAGSK